MEKYKNMQKVGYQAIREARYKKMVNLGLVDPQEKRARANNAPWKSLSDNEKQLEALHMAVYTAMINCLDQNIGKLIETLKEQGKFENNHATSSRSCQPSSTLAEPTTPQSSAKTFC